MNLTGNGKVVLSGCLSAAACVRLVLYYFFFVMIFVLLFVMNFKARIGCHDDEA